MELKFYYCKHCGKVIVIVKNTPVPTICCGEPMAELVPGVTDEVWNILLEMQKDGTVEAIGKKWFGKDISVIK